ncbi:MAG TPA: cyanophycinase [Chryseolinea sp.]|nr:cyanophycinase [Chryseolinea sp.]
MSPFEFTTVLISIILGLGITTILTGVAGRIKHFHQTIRYAPDKIMRTKFCLFLLLPITLQFTYAQDSKSNEVDESQLIYFGIGITGSKEDVTVPTKSGIVLVGGSTDVDEAILWMIDRAKGGDFVIIRASGSTGYNDYIKELGDLNSVETLMIDSREKAMSAEVGKRIREAEAIFIAGGDQANYVNFWTDSEVSSALDYLIHKKKIPIGGTSAGCAILSELVFDSKKGTVTSTEALANPYDTLVSLSKSFIHLPYLTNTLADQHYSQRERHGRHITFLARMMHDRSLSEIKGIGVDEQTAVCIDENGNAKIFGKNKAYFIISNGKTPEKCEANTPLVWDVNDSALKVFIYAASAKGTEAFNIKSWPKTPTQFWHVENGVLKERDD